MSATNELEGGVGRTRTLEIFSALKEAILSATLMPGQRLRFDELRERFDIGISPLREALTRLAGEGLVILEERRGCRVAPVSRADLTELATLRAEFDIIAMREAIRTGDRAWEGRILAVVHELQGRQKMGPDGRMDAEWEDVHIRFHNALCETPHLPRLATFRQILDDQAMRYRRMSMHYLKAPRDIAGEHQAMAEAVLARRADDAAYLIRKHYMRTVEIILADPNATFEP